MSPAGGQSTGESRADAAPLAAGPAANRTRFYDTHVHFFDRSEPGLRYEWLEDDAEDPDLGEYGAIKARRYRVDDFTGETRFSGVTAAVHVQAAVGTSDPVRETAWLDREFGSAPFPQAIVAAADLARDDAGDIVEQQAAFPRVRGIRDLRYDGYLSDPRWRRGYAHLERHRLLLCADPLLEAIPAAVDLARQFPGIQLCIDHAGYPRQRDAAYFEQWRLAMASLAACDNVVIKISGLGMCDHRWTTDSIRPWVLSCIDLFGTQRSFFGTNWPLDRLFSSYGDVLDAYRACTSEFEPAESDALLYGNAARIFGGASPDTSAQGAAR
jgi:predicted TIM-barrel fold metal-dependent hydrolase